MTVSVDPDTNTNNNKIIDIGRLQKLVGLVQLAKNPNY